MFIFQLGGIGLKECSECFQLQGYLTGNKVEIEIRAPGNNYFDNNIAWGPDKLLR